jgi:sulfatase modifying factor 1
VVVAALVGSVCLLGGCHLIFPFDDTSPGDATESDLTTDGPQVDGSPKLDGTPKLDTLPTDGPVQDHAPGDSGGGPPVWILIQQAQFNMGSHSSEPCRYTDEDQHKVTLTHGFLIQATEVTQTQFQAELGYDPSQDKSCAGVCPVEHVTWHEAAAYCNALSKKSTLPTCYTCQGSNELVNCQEAAVYTGKKIYTCPGYRLPTEAEWEWAYRAGSTTAFYLGANDASKCYDCTQLDAVADTIGWYCANSSSTKHPVDQKQKNAWGLAGMAGNVSEWCNDWYLASLGTAPVSDPIGVSNGTKRVVRGGSQLYAADSLRAAWRFKLAPMNSINAIGFRCVKTK